MVSAKLQGLAFVGFFWYVHERMAIVPVPRRSFLVLNLEICITPRALFRWASLWALSLALGCVTTRHDDATYGVQPGREGFVPARIAVLPCQVWPSSAPFQTFQSPNVSAEILKDICGTFDRLVLAGFERQPYMKGFSPKFVKKALEEAGHGHILEAVPRLWTPEPPGCTKASSVTACYAQHLSQIPAWNTWLATVSDAARHADAVLIPLLTHVREERYTIRGLELAERRLGVDLLLVSTHRGILLWAGGRTSPDATKRLTSKEPLENLPYPAWEDVLTLVFNDTLWRDFPGRQVL